MTPRELARLLDVLNCALADLPPSPERERLDTGLRLLGREVEELHAKVERGLEAVARWQCRHARLRRRVRRQTRDVRQVVRAFDRLCRYDPVATARAEDTPPSAAELPRDGLARLLEGTGRA